MGEDEAHRNGFLMKTSDVLGHSLEGLTGVAASTREQWARSVGYILQRTRAGHFTEALKKEWEKYKQEGRIKDDYEFTEQCQSCLQELLDFLDKDLPDEQRFKVLKQIFLVAATEAASDRNSHLPLQYMQIARRLTAGEVLVLNTTYRLAKEGRSFAGGGGVISADKWLEGIAGESGLTHKELVEMHEAELIKKYLLTDRKTKDRSVAYIGGSNSRLTMLGHAICEYIAHYNE